MGEIRKLTPVMHKIFENSIIQCTNTYETAYNSKQINFILE